VGAELDRDLRDQIAKGAMAGPRLLTSLRSINENTGSHFNLIVNVRKPPFDQKTVRQALSYSLNRVEMAKSAFFGVSRPVASSFFNPASLAYRADLMNAYPFDLAKAARLLAQAGVHGLQMSTVVTPRWPQMKLFCLIWQQDLAKIGVRLTVSEVEIAKFYQVGGAADLEGNDVLPWINARTAREPAIFWGTQVNYRGDARNIYGYRNAELEQLVAQGAVEPVLAKRRQIYQRLNEIVVDECQMIPIATDPRIWAFETRVTGVHIDLSGNLFLDSASMS
jgi:peptide/nickel transport system substrate-binding protein